MSKPTSDEIVDMPARTPAFTTPDLWLDGDHFVEYTYQPGESEPSGGTLWHRKADSPSGWCCGAFYWRYPAHWVTGNHGVIPDHGPTWQLVSKEPLHLEPSFLCSCGHHGFIREGKWIQA